jgi:hypothetical protein
MAEANSGPSFEEKIVARFDSLRSDGRLFYDETTPEVVDSSGFKVIPNSPAISFHP